MELLSDMIEQVHIVKKYRAYYKEYKVNPSDRAFFEGYKAQITLYENALSELKKSYSKLPNSKDILAELNKLQEKRIPSCKSILLRNLLWASFIKYEKTMEFTWIRGWRDSHLLYLIEEISITFSSPKNSFAFPNMSESLVGIYIIKSFFALVIHT